MAALGRGSPAGILAHARRDAAARARRALAALEAFALPLRCPGCGAPATRRRVLCDACWAAIPGLDQWLCARCLGRGDDPARCRIHRGYACWCAWVYDDRAACLVQTLKYQGRRALARGLGGRLAQSLSMHYRPDLVVEVPMHGVRRRERGFNQAAWLAEAVAARLAAPWLEGALTRVHPTPPQTRLGAAARRSNLRGAFRVRDPEALRGRKVLLVDDVITTGSTVEACLDVLQASGAEAVAAALAWAS